MAAFRLTARALRDIDRIWLYIARDSVAAADRVENAILDACKTLGQNPSLGHSLVAVTTKPIWFWTLSEYPNYIVTYRRSERGVQILRVVHGRQNLRRILKF
jgi:toxin ParE1/3/4